MASPHFTKALLLSVWFLWKTMHAGTRDLPVWLVGLFAITNVSHLTYARSL